MAKKRSAPKSDPLLQILTQQTAILQRIEQKLDQGGTSGERIVREDVGKGPRNIPIRRAPHQEVAGGQQGSDGGRDRRPAGEDIDPDLKLKGRRDAAREAGLMAGDIGAVSSYNPSGQAEVVPPREAQEKQLYAVGDCISCTICRRPVYEVTKDITTFTPLSELPGRLSPWSAEVPMLTGTEPVRRMPGTALNCPLCMGDWGVVII